MQERATTERLPHLQRANLYTFPASIARPLLNRGHVLKDFHEFDSRGALRLVVYSKKALGTPPSLWRAPPSERNSHFNRPRSTASVVHQTH